MCHSRVLPWPDGGSDLVEYYFCVDPTLLCVLLNHMVSLTLIMMAVEIMCGNLSARVVGLGEKPYSF